MSRWTTPEGIAERLRRLWERGEILANRLEGTSRFPLALRITRPDPREVADQFPEVRAWVATLEQASRAARGAGYEIEWEDINNRQTGRNRLPRAVVIPSESDAFALLGADAQVARWDELVHRTTADFPQLREWILRGPLRLLEHEGEWEHILSVLRWFAENPRSQRYIRQIDVPGVDSKFVESRRSLLTELLDLVLTTEHVDQRATGAKGFEQRFGLQTRPTRLRIRSLDPAVRFGGLTDVEAPLSEWARAQIPIDRLVITENETNFLAFPDLPRSAIAFGAGYSVDRLAELPWLRDRVLFYWGDIDTHGFGILDLLRRSFPNARSFLMDEDTLLSHRRSWVEEQEPLAIALEHLTADENELYEGLRRDRFGPSVRLEQERIGFAHVQRALQWIQENSATPYRRATARGFVFETEQPTWVDQPDGWLDPRRVRNWVLGDPILDWLDLHGRDAGFQRDDELPGYDPRTDFRLFISAKSRPFFEGVVALLGEKAEVRRVAPQEDRVAHARETADALSAGVGVVTGGLLQDPLRGTNCEPDLLLRSDLLDSWFPGLMLPGEAAAPAPALGLGSFHYRPLLVGFRTFDITADGHVSTSADQLVYAAEAWFHATALGALQGRPLPCAYLLGRNWRQDGARGAGTLERLARVDVDRRIPQRDCGLGDVARASMAWLRRLQREGHDWRVLPEPSVPELYPHARNRDDAPWHDAKRRLAAELEELTLLPGMNLERRQLAHDVGLKRWRQAGVSANSLGITSPMAAAQLEAVLEANRSAVVTVVPARIEVESDQWRRAPAVEFYVDFETVSHLEDDLADLPRQGGQVLIAQVGCGHLSTSGEWRFAQWTVDRLDVEEERKILDAWVGHMIEVSAAAGTNLDTGRICHWSAAERVQLDTAYDSARTRHSTSSWPERLPWFDVLQEVIRAGPIGITGAFNFGLKAIAKAMHAAGFITTTWPSGPTDGLGAMVGTWNAARESAELSSHPLMLDVARYNEVDCRVMMEILAWLRKAR